MSGTGREKQERSEVEFSAELRRSLENDIRESIRRSVAATFQRQREILVRGALEYLWVNISNVAAIREEWIPIHSLSKLRSVVGGKFANLKRRWLKCGLPLRESRGDRSEIGVMDSEGWVELSGWILEQGYESRVSENGAGSLFEVRQATLAQRGSSTPEK